MFGFHDGCSHLYPSRFIHDKLLILSPKYFQICLSSLWRDPLPHSTDRTSSTRASPGSVTHGPLLGCTEPAPDFPVTALLLHQLCASAAAWRVQRGLSATWPQANERLDLFAVRLKPSLPAEPDSPCGPFLLGDDGNTSHSCPSSLPHPTDTSWKPHKCHGLR